MRHAERLRQGTKRQTRIVMHARIAEVVPARVARPHHPWCSQFHPSTTLENSRPVTYACLPVSSPTKKDTIAGMNEHEPRNNPTRGDRLVEVIPLMSPHDTLRQEIPTFIPEVSNEGEKMNISAAMLRGNLSCMQHSPSKNGNSTLPMCGLACTIRCVNGQGSPIDPPRSPSLPLRPSLLVPTSLRNGTHSRRSPASWALESGNRDYP